MKSPQCNATRELATFLASLRYTDLPEQVITSMKRCLLEILSGAACGYGVDYIRKLDEALPLSAVAEATVIGSGRARSAEQAAFINGSAAVVKEYIGGHRFSYSMPVIGAIPAALACAERNGASGTELLLAMAAGTEAHARIGMATLPMKMTFHPHATLAVLGGAGAVGKLEKLDAEGMYALFNLAAVLPLFGHRRTTFEGGTVRNTYPGFAASNAILAGELLRAGVCGVEDGLVSCYADTIAEQGLDADVLLGELGKRYECARNYYKLQACDRHLHGCVEVVAQLMRDNAALVPDAVASVQVLAYSRAARCSLKNPRNAIASQWSIPHGIAAMLVLGCSDTRAYAEEAVHDPRIRALAERVEVAEEPAFTAREPQQRPVAVRITLKDGTVLSGESAIASGEFDSGEPDAALEARVLEKCRNLFAQGGFDSARIDRIEQAVLGLEHINRVTELTGLLGR